LEGELLLFAFRANKPPECQPFARGKFVEGLWTDDVAELFLAGPGNDYQEFNFSPTGAWWSACFSNYRQRDRLCPDPAPQLECLSGPDFWEISCILTLSSLLPWQGCSIDQRRLHVASVLFPTDPEYLCSGHSSGGTPDFHLLSNFHPPTHCNEAQVKG